VDEKNREYSNKDITIYWKPGKCIHASTCYIQLIDVFNPSKRPWINMNGASTEKIIEITNKCPTEALMWKWNDEKKNENIAETEKNHIKIRKPFDFYKIRNDEKKAPKENAVNVRLMKNGPLIAEGEFKVVDSEGEEIKTGSFTSFCRCGQSNAMPFCDGMHRKIGFQD